MNESFTLNAKKRIKTGKRANYRLRLKKMIPAVIYGGDLQCQNITIEEGELAKAAKMEGFFSHILNIREEDKLEQVVAKDILFHPYKPIILHADFMRVKADTKIDVVIPLHFINEENAIGVKKEGGQMIHHETEVEIRCFPADLPEFIAVDVFDLKLNQMICIKDLKLPNKIELLVLLQNPNNNLSIVSCEPQKIHEEVEGETVQEEKS